MIALPERGICAHRGAMGTHPQNTLAAFREAIRLGAQMVEFDARKSRDDELVLYHDLTLARFTGREERPEELTLAELKRIDIGSCRGEQFEGERIPTLEEALVNSAPSSANRYRSSVWTWALPAGSIAW